MGKKCDAGTAGETGEEIEGLMITCYFQWANEHGRAGMPTPEELERQGWIRCKRHHIWPSSWLMKYEVITQDGGI